MNRWVLAVTIILALGGGIIGAVLLGRDPPPPPDPEILDRGVLWAEATPVVTDHHEITTNCPRRIALEYQTFLEALYDALDDHFRGIHPVEPFMTRVFITRNQEEFIALTGAEQVAGFWIASSGAPNLPADTIVTYHGPHARRLLAHEMTHKFQRMMGHFQEHVPPWLMEGQAVYFEAARQEDGEVITGAVDRGRLFQIKRTLRDGGPPSLEALIRVPRQQYAGYFYPWGWSLVYWMNHADEGKHRPVFDGLWRMAMEEPLSVDAVRDYLEESLDMGLDEFAKKVWIPYLEEMPLPPPGEVQGDRFVSYQGGLEFRLPGWSRDLGPPGSGWTFEFDDFPGDREPDLERLCVLVNGSLEGAEIDIAVRPLEKRPWEVGQRGVIDEMVARTEAEFYENDMRPEDVEMGGRRGVRFAFVDRGAFEEAFRTDETDEGSETAHVLVCVPVAGRYFEFHATCRVGDRERVEKDFDRLVGSVRIED